MTELIFVIPGMKVNGKYHCDVLLSQQMLPAIKHVASNTFVFRQDNAPSHGAKDTIKQLQQETPVLIPGHQTAQTGIHWIIRSGVLCSRECMNVMNSVDELKQRLIDVWNSLQQNVIDATINEWRKQLRACVHADGQHFEHYIESECD